jgi:hypothetical protein
VVGSFAVFIFVTLNNMEKFTLRIREVRILESEISAKTEEAAAAKLKARYLDGDTEIATNPTFLDVEVRNSKGVELEVLELPSSTPFPPLRK